MKPKRQKIEFVSEEKRNEYLKTIIAYFHDVRNEKIGFVAAEDILDFFIANLGEEIYRKAIKDIQKTLREKMEDLDIEIELLVQK
jgi:uncharacterized protein (DUF2164 family)